MKNMFWRVQRVRSLVSSALGPPPQIPRGPASRAGLLRLRALTPADTDEKPV
ncbi:hypothetical protein PC128_g26562 [Phytophthora cactorum]|nr:hypothetical protein PC128_g26562 [Phytophthora cactorum]KAG4042057.1 hypothetical protein PC123_g22446 [Phytophthora cactorum]